MHLTGRNYWWYQAKEQLMTRFLERVGPRVGQDGQRQILDIGCGTGTMFGFLAERGRVIGLEPSSRAIAYARTRQNASLVQGDAAETPFAPKSFDLITLFDSLEHMEKDLAALRNARSLIRSGGALLVTAPAFQWLRSWRETQLGHRRRYTVSTLRYLLLTAGFTPVRISYMYAGLFPILIAKSIKDRLIRPPERFKSDIVMLPEPWNSLLTRWFRTEAEICDRFGLPFGTSVVCLAKPTPSLTKDIIE
ncbi:class I SAM-dependent methyltransferase [bacterium]|nr:class I SAM-dependent methyltransferase [candidate division CSSED10-310 bacterium]